MRSPDPHSPQVALFRFYGPLRELARPAPRSGTGTVSREILYLFYGNPSVKDALEAQGVVHVEVELILINGEPATFLHRIHGGDRISVYPFFFDLAPAADLSLRPPSPETYRFILDVHLGRLARYLRLLGFDTLYRNDYDDHEIVRLSRAEERTVLTCDRGLLKHGALSRGHYLRSRHSEEQLREVVEAFSLETRVHPLTRCVHCNGPLEQVEKESIRSMLEAKTALYYDTFFSCALCHRIYWHGSHLDRLPLYIKSLMERESC